MWKVRQAPPEVRYRNHSPRRGPRVPRGNHGAPSSDPEVPPEQTFAERLKLKRRWAAQKRLHAELMETLKRIALGGGVQNPLWNGEFPEEFWKHHLKHLGRSKRKDKLAEKERDRRTWSAAKDYRRLDNCQREWIGFKPSCCNSRAVAIPIGCRHRLCPLCNAVRLQQFRAPARDMLEHMENPTFLTLTIPNQKHLSRKLFSDLRGDFKRFFRSNKGHLRGGMYAIETEYNRERADWHPHIHCIFDASFPYQDMKDCENCRRLAKHGIDRRDFTPEDKLRCECSFIIAKLLIEFSWLCITSDEARKTYRRNEFERWRRDIAEHPAGDPWNQTFRRIVDVRAAVKGEKAVCELIKYVTKSVQFLDLPEAVEEFLRAVRNVRTLHTFGTFYNFKLEVPITKKQMEEYAMEGLECDQVLGAASFLRCECGANKFKNIGVFSMNDVEMDANGRWLLKRSCERRRCRESPVNKGESTDGFY